MREKPWKTECLKTPWSEFCRKGEMAARARASRGGSEERSEGRGERRLFIERLGPADTVWIFEAYRIV